MNPKKLLIMLVLVTSCLIFAAPLAVYSEENSNQDEAEILRAMGLFVGSDKGFELERTATRAESAVMLVRLMGKEEIARKTNFVHPFKDVPNWASAYIGYMYHTGLTNGIDHDRYGALESIDSRSYVTFLLRALGYDDHSGDFAWSDAISKATEMGLIEKSDNQRIVEGNTVIRDDVVGLSYKALGTNMKNMQVTLLQKLVNEGALGSQQACSYKAVQSIPIDITSGLEYIWYDCYYKGILGGIAFIDREKLPLPLQNFVSAGTLAKINKEITSYEWINQFNEKYPSPKRRYNTAGCGNVAADFEQGNVAVQLFDANDRLIGYHFVTKEEVLVHKLPIVDIVITFSSNFSGKMSRDDIKITRLINGQVDPDFLWTGGIWENDGNQITIKYFLSGDKIDFKVESAQEEIKIEKVEILPSTNLGVGRH